MLRYKNYIFFLLLIFSFNISSSQVIWRDSTGYIADTVYIDTTAFNLYGPFQYAKPTTASFLYLAPTYPNLSVPGWNNAIHNYQDKSFPYKSSPPYFNYNGVLYNPYDSRIFTDSLYGKLVGKLPENFLSEDVWIGAPVLNKPIYYRGSNGVGSVLKWKYAFFPYYKFPLYRNEDTVGVVFPDSLFFGGGVSDSSVVADVIKVNDTTLEIKRKAHIYNKGHYIRRTRLDSFLVSLSSSYYTYNNYYFDTTINNNYYNIDTNYYISNYYIDTNYYYNIYNIDTNYYIYNIDTNYYIYQIDTNIYITNNYYTANPDTFVTGIYAYLENDSLKIELTRSQGAPMLFTSVKLQINGMQKHSINDTTWHTGYPLNIWRGGTNYSNYQSNQNKLPSFLDYINEQIRPSNTFAADMYVDKGINFIWRTNYGSWRMFGDYNNSNLRYLYDNELPGITFWYNNPFQGYGISTNRYLVINNGVIAGSMFAEDSCLGFTNGYWNRLVYKNDMTLNGVKPAKSFEDVVPLKQLYDSCIWRHGFTGTITSVSDFTICDDTIKMYLNDITYFDGLIRNVSPRVKKVPACVKTNIPPQPVPEPEPEPEPDPPYNPSCRGSNVFSVECTGSIQIIQEFYVGLGFSSSAIRKNNTVYIKIKNLTEDTYKGIENNDTLYMQVQTLDQGIAGNWYEIVPQRFKLAPNDSQIVSIILSDNASDYSYWLTENDGRIFKTMILKFLSLGDMDYYNNIPKPILCSSFGSEIKVIPLEGYTSYTYEQAPKREEIYLTHLRDCSEDRVYFGNRIITGQYFNYETEIKFEQDSVSFVSPKLNMELSLKVWFKNEPSPRIVVINKGTIYDFYNPNIQYNLYNITKNDLRNIWSDFSEDKVVGYKAFFHFSVDTFLNIGLQQYEFETLVNNNITYERKTIPFTRMYARSIENEAYWDLTLTEKLRLTLDMKWDLYDVCNGTPPKVSDYDPGGTVGMPDTNVVVHDTLWIADRFAQHNILDTSSHKGISLNSTSSKNLPIWLYDGTQFIKSDYTINDIITSSADTVISIVDTNVIATKYYVDSKSNTADSSIFATRYWSDGLFLKKVDTTNKWQPKGDYASSNHSHTNYIQKGYAYADLMENNYIGNQSGQVAAGNHNHNGEYITPTDTTNKWQPKGNYASSDHQHTLTQIVGQGYNHNDIIKWDAYTSMWEVGSMPAGGGDLSKSDSNVYFYRPWKIDNLISSRLPIYNPFVFGTLSIVNNQLEGTPTSELWTTYTDVGSYNPMLNTDARYITINGDTAATRDYVRNYILSGLQKSDSNTYYYRPWKIDNMISNRLPVSNPTTIGTLSITNNQLEGTPTSAIWTTYTDIGTYNPMLNTDARYIKIYNDTAATRSYVREYTYSNFALSSHTHSNYAPTFTVNSPLTYSNNVIGINQASSSTSGYLSSTDWNTFNSKASTDWVNSNFLSLSGGSLSGGLFAPYFYMNGNLVATQSWVSGSYSPLGHTHSGYATESWVSNNFSSINHNHNSSYLSLSGGQINGSLNVTGTLQMNENLVATQSWVSSNYASQSWVNSNYIPKSTGYTNYMAVQNSSGTLSFGGWFFGGDNLTSDVPIHAPSIRSTGGFTSGSNQGQSGTVSKTFVTGVSLNKTKDYIEYKDWGGNNLQMEVVTDVSLNVSTATITLQFDGGLYIGSSGWSGLYKEGEIHLTMNEFEKLKNNTWQIDPEYLEFLEWKQWKKEQENKIKVVKNSIGE